MKIKYLLPGFVLLAIFGLFFLRSNEPEPIATITTSQDISEEVLGIDTKSKTMGAVEVEVTPVKLEPGEVAVFKLTLNTHSIDLGYDYTQISSLIDDIGNSYQASEWSGGTNGHHLSGELVFEELSENLTQVQLTIDGIDNEKSIFEWGVI